MQERDQKQSRFIVLSKIRGQSLQQSLCLITPLVLIVFTAMSPTLHRSAKSLTHLTLERMYSNPQDVVLFVFGGVTLLLTVDHEEVLSLKGRHHGSICTQREPMTHPQTRPSNSLPISTTSVNNITSSTTHNTPVFLQTILT